MILRWLLKLYASSSGGPHLFVRGVWEIIRRFLMLLGDPPYRTTLHGKEILLPVSHKVPLYIANCRFYDELPGRASAFVRSLHGSLTMIDVGANVGDTILYCYDDPCDSFLAIEVNPIFIKYLKQNTSQIKSVELVEAFCSSGDGDEIPVKIAMANGTASVIRDQKGTVLPRRKLDTILADHPRFAQCNFLMTDTDGSDFDVIRGARETIARSKPLILMECDVFENRNYVSDFSDTMEFLEGIGYETVIAYDNLGYLFDVFQTKNWAEFKFALFHQLFSKTGYYDLLVLHSAHRALIDRELAYFANTLSDEHRRYLAGKILGL